MGKHALDLASFGELGKSPGVTFRDTRRAAVRQLSGHCFPCAVAGITRKGTRLINSGRLVLTACACCTQPRANPSAPPRRPRCGHARRRVATRAARAQAAPRVARACVPGSIWGDWPGDGPKLVAEVSRNAGVIFSRHTAAPTPMVQGQSCSGGRRNTKFGNMNSTQSRTTPPHNWPNAQAQGPRAHARLPRERNSRARAPANAFPTARARACQPVRAPAHASARARRTTYAARAPCAARAHTPATQSQAAAVDPRRPFSGPSSATAPVMPLGGQSPQTKPHIGTQARSPCHSPRLLGSRRSSLCWIKQKTALKK